MKYNRLPNNLIVYENGNFIFADGFTCTPAEIVNIEYNQAHTIFYIWNVDQDYGSLTVITKYRTISYDQVANVKEAQTKLMYYITHAHDEKK